MIEYCSPDRDYCLEVRKASAKRSFNNGDMSAVEYRNAVAFIDQLGITTSLAGRSVEVRAAKATYADVDTCGECGATGQYDQYCAECGEAMTPSKQPNKFCPSCGSKVTGNRAGHVCSEVAGDYRRRLVLFKLSEDVNGN